MRAEARRALQAEANYAVADMRRKTPLGKTGNLLRGVARIDVDAVGLTAAIRAVAQHSHLVEWDHRIVTRAGRDTGRRSIRAAPSFFVVPAQQARRRLYEELRRILARPIAALGVTPEVRER